MSEKANDLLSKFGSAQFDFMVWNTPDNLVARDKARQEIYDYIAELEAENETIISDYEERMDNLVNIGNETGRLLQAEIGYLNAQLGIKNLTTETLQLRIAELEHRNKVLEDACEMLRKENGRVTQLLDFWKGLSTNGSKVQESEATACKFCGSNESDRRMNSIVCSGCGRKIGNVVPPEVQE